MHNELKTIIEQAWENRALLQDPAVQQAVRETRPRLRMALGAMFPGKLLLCFDTEMLNQAIAQRIEQMNGVQDVPPGVRRLGPYMCVPYCQSHPD